MIFNIRATEDTGWELILTDEPPYIQALKAMPGERESELNVGMWLVVAFAVWSGPDFESVRAAIACAKNAGGQFQLGIRPFDDYDEFSTWWPPSQAAPLATKSIASPQRASQRRLRISTDPHATPRWLVLRNGQVIAEEVGTRTVEELRELMQAATGPA